MNDNDPILVAYRERMEQLRERYKELHSALQDADKDGETYRDIVNEMGAIRAEQYARPPNADYLRYEDCKVGFTYAIYSRNLMFGVFSGGSDGGFVGIREKFGDLYLFTEYHRDRGGMVGTVAPYRMLEKCPLVDIREGWRGGCKLHDRPCEYDETQPRLNPYATDGRMYPGTWIHTDDRSIMPDEDSSTWVRNKKLFEYLEGVEQRWDWRQIMNETRFKDRTDLQY